MSVVGVGVGGPGAWKTSGGNNILPGSGTTLPNTKKQTGGKGREVDPNALIGADTKKLIGQGKLILEGGKYYMPTGSPTSGPFRDYQNKPPPPLKPLKLPPLKMTTGGGDNPEPPNIFGGSGGGGNPPPDSSFGPMMSGLSRATGTGSDGGGMNLSGLGALAGGMGDAGAEVGMSMGGADAIDVDVPKAPGMEIGAASQGAGNTQQLNAPGGLRPGLGSRIYPALNALLKTPAY
jgi:hypothetical protein